jgi:hypothetical protein
VRLPLDSEGILIVGRRGSGKTMEALHHLSQRSIGEKPWIVIDFKGDDLVSKIPTSAPASLTDPPPHLPGLYVVRAEIADHRTGGAVNDYLQAIYEQGNTGVFIDEGLMLGQHNRGLRLMLTQGRSRGCPMILVTQRPFNIDTYAFSESEYIQVFFLQVEDDQDRVYSFFSRQMFSFEELREKGLYHSCIYDVRANVIEYLDPCPPFEAIYDRILTRLPLYVEPEPPPIPRRTKL